MVKREGLIYICRWKKLPDGSYKGAVAKPKLEVEADSLEEMARELTEEIASATGDMEPIVEFEPPDVPSGRRALFRDGIVALSCGSHFRFVDVANLTTGGFCDCCGSPVGDRATQPIAVKDMWPGDVSHSLDDRTRGMTVLLFSQSLLDGLSRADRSAFTSRAVAMPKGTRKHFIEIVPKATVPEVAVKSIAASGWRCARCGHIELGHKKLGWCVPAITRDSIPKASLFFIGTTTDFRLCIKRKRWEKLKDFLRKAGFQSFPVAVIDAGEVNKKPRLQVMKPRKLRKDK